MSYAYNTAKKARRKSKPKHGHTIQQHTRRLTPTEKLRELFKRFRIASEDDWNEGGKAAGGTFGT